MYDDDQDPELQYRKGFDHGHEAGAWEAVDAILTVIKSGVWSGESLEEDIKKLELLIALSTQNIINPKVIEIR
jgi:hypothetical protein